MLKKVCLDLFTILLPLFLILTPHPIFAQDIIQNYSPIDRTVIDTSSGSVENSLKEAIRYWWIAPLALIPLLFFLWPKEENSRRAYRRSTVYQSVRRPKKIATKRSSMGKRKRI